MSQAGRFAGDSHGNGVMPRELVIRLNSIMTNENFIVIQLVLMWFCQKDISEDKNTTGRVGSLAMPHPQDHFQKVSKKPQFTTKFLGKLPGSISESVLHRTMQDGQQSLNLQGGHSFILQLRTKEGKPETPFSFTYLQI